MIRQPSTMRQLYAWHRAALAGQNPEVHDSLPQCGWYRARMVRGGPWVPVRIWCAQDICPESGELQAPERMLCEAAGERADPVRLWTYLIPISRADFDALVERRTATPAMLATHAKYDLTQTAMRP